MRSEPGAHAAFVSNLGQVRNFAAIRDQAGLPAARIFVLYTTGNPVLGQTLIEVATAFGFAVTPVLLPRAPNTGFPWTINKITRIYDDLCAAGPVDTLWLCNNNSHYGYLAHRFSMAGAQIAYFEEGLGTYLQVTDPPYAPSGFLTELRALLGQIDLALRARSLTARRRLRRIGFHGCRFLFGTAPGRLAAHILTAGKASHFHNHRSSFDHAIVSFPNRLDPAVIRPDSTARLNLPLPDQTRPPLPCGPDGIAALCRTVFLHQSYGFAPALWAGAIAAALLEKDIRSIIVKFHPRDQTDFKAKLLSQLAAHGITAHSDPALDRLPAECALLSPEIDRVIGITSSTLIYGPEMTRSHPEIRTEFLSIATSILRYLEPAMPRRSPEVARLRAHAALFSRVSSGRAA